jgi:UDP-2,3-diacylglucosamine pyrophosphatase LpxH
MKHHYKSIFISDVHLGTRDCKSLELINFLKYNKCETLYLVGDIIDGWKIQRNKWYWDQSHTTAVQKILKHARRGASVIYVTGNHDEFLRPLIPYNIGFGDIKVVNQYEHIGVDGKRYLVIHGDLFDGISAIAPWLGFIGDTGYDVLLRVNHYLNVIRGKFGREYWSISKYVKYRVKSVVDFMFKFEDNLVNYCAKRKFDGIICGHIHHAEIKDINGIAYMNDGDWVESMTALVEHFSGEWEIIVWDKIINEE